MINTFRKGAGYKINTYKSGNFLYTNIKHTEKEIKKTIAFTVASTRKYLGKYLTKEAKDFTTKI